MKPYLTAHLRATTIVVSALLALLFVAVPLTHAQASTTAYNPHTATHHTYQQYGPYHPEVIASINATFGIYAYQALQVANCESGYNPSAYNASSGASGVFQVIPGTWAGTSQRWYSPFNSWANVAAAHEIFVRDGNSWKEWVCKPW